MHRAKALAARCILRLTSGSDWYAHGDLRVGRREVDIILKTSTRVGSALRTCMPRLQSAYSRLSHMKQLNTVL